MKQKFTINPKNKDPFKNTCPLEGKSQLNVFRICNKFTEFRSFMALSEIIVNLRINHKTLCNNV